MQKWLFRSFMLLILLLAACTPRIYGIPQERWQTMTEQERIAAMEAYKARQEVLRQQREEQARLRAMEKKAQLAREAEDAHRRQLQVDAVYRGEGLYGDLLRVTLNGGMLKVYGAHKPFHPVSFKIAAGETKQVEIVSHRGRKTRMVVSYDGSNLVLDEKPSARRSMALRLPYEDSWERGVTYPNRFTKGPLEMRGVNVTVQIVGQPPRDHRGRRHRPHEAMSPTVRHPHRPEVNVVKKPVLQPKPEVAVIERHHRPQKPDVIVSKPKPDAAKPGKIVEHRPRPKEIMHRPPARIKVVFRKGRLKFKKHGYALFPQTVDLRDGQIRNIIIRSHKGNLKIQVSYRGGELLIDDTPGRGRKQTRLGFSPGWKNGQAYLIKTSENHLLEDLDLFVVSK